MSVTKTEAQTRIQNAMDVLEFRVQVGLLGVSEHLSRITHCPEYDDIYRLYTEVKALWYKLDARSQPPKVDLDPEAAAKFLKELRSTPNE